jgi:hypothetical protein
LNDLSGLTTLWLLIGCFIAQAIGRVSDLGSESEKQDEMPFQPRINDEVVSRRCRDRNGKGLCASQNRKLAETDRGETKEEERKLAA